jgi:hypothetical protein
LWMLTSILSARADSSITRSENANSSISLINDLAIYEKWKYWVQKGVFLWFYRVTSLCSAVLWDISGVGWHLLKDDMGCKTSRNNPRRVQWESIWL